MLNHKEQIGKLDRRLTFQEKVIGSNESNEDEELGWVNISANPTVWASRSDGRGTERFAADRLTGFQGASFITRFRSDIDIKMRIVCEDVAYNIISISEIGRRQYMEIVTESGYEYVGDEASAFTRGFSPGFR